MREQREGAPRIGNAARLFFQPLEPFLVDDRGEHKHPGRIARASLEPLWNWIRRDLLPDDAKVLDRRGQRRAACRRRAEGRANLTVHSRTAPLPRSRRAFDAGRRRRKSPPSHAGADRHARAGEDATTLICTLKGRDALATLAAHLPFASAILANGRLDECQGADRNDASHATATSSCTRC